jgi:hypothetical protein
MIKILFILLTASISARQPTEGKKLRVIDRAVCTRVDPAFTLKDADTTFMFKGAKYLIQCKEFFDSKGNIISAVINGDVGYTSFKRAEIDKIKDFFEANDLIPYIDAYIADNQHIVINKKKIKVIMIDKKSKKIYYSLREKEILYRITYK